LFAFFSRNKAAEDCRSPRRYRAYICICKRRSFWTAAVLCRFARAIATLLSVFVNCYAHLMLIVHVHVHVKLESVDAFKKSTTANAQASRKEPGIARFDLLQQSDDATRFVLVEAYRNGDAPAAHKETEHYKTWRDTVAPMMAEPRQSVKLSN